MPIPKAQEVEVNEREQSILEQIERQGTAPHWLVIRSKIVLGARRRASNRAIAVELGLNRNTVQYWRGRWQKGRGEWAGIEDEKALRQAIERGLADAARSGTPSKFSAEQIVQLVAVACEAPQASGYPISHWSPKEVAQEAIKRGIVDSISERQVGRFLKRG